MTILQAGMAKSGNYWLYRIIQSGLRQSGCDPSTFIQKHPVHEEARHWDLSFQGQADVDVLDIEEDGCWFRISSRFRERVADLDEYVRSSSHVWTHSYVNPNSHAVLPLFEHIVYIVRDPRDVLLSLSHFMFTDYMERNYPHNWTDRRAFLDRQLVSHHRRWVRHVGGYLANAESFGMHVVFFERLRSDFKLECADLLDYLGFPSDEETVTEIEREVDIHQMRERDPGHVRRGARGGWEREFDPTMKRLSTAVAGDMLKYLSYPVDGDGNVEELPQLPTPLRSDVLRSFVESTSQRPSGVAYLVNRARQLFRSSVR